MLGFDRDDGFAEYVSVPERCFLPVESRLDLDDAAMLLDATGTAMHALRRLGCFEAPPESALVMGAGPVGLGCVLVLRAVGVTEVVAVDVAPFRLGVARRLGARPVVGGEAATDSVRAADASYWAWAPDGTSRNTGCTACLSRGLGSASTGSKRPCG